MGLLKHHINNNFTIISNKAITAPISAGALRVYLYLLSKPDGWQVVNADIKKNIYINDNHTLASYLKELEDKKLLHRIKLSSGHFEYHLHEYVQMREIHNCENNLADGENPQEPYGENPQVGKIPIYNNTDIKYNNNTNITNTNKHSVGVNLSEDKINSLHQETQNKSTNTPPVSSHPPVQFDFDGFTAQEKEAIENWLAHRKQIKKQYKTLQSLKAFRTMLLKFKGQRKSIIDIFEYSLAQGYTGLIDLDKSSKRYPKNIKRDFNHVGDFSHATEENCVQLVSKFKTW